MTDDTPHDVARTFLDELETERIPPFSALSVQGARDLHRRLSARPPDAEPEPVGDVRDFRIPGPVEDVPIRVYTPDGAGPFPVLIYYHGGGWVVGDLDAVDPLCRALTTAAGCAVVSVDYRLAPEHPFPAPVEDAHAAFRWVVDEGDAVGCDPERVAVSGDSAGGNLAAAVSLLARDRGGPTPDYQLLVYPVTDRNFETDSYVENADGYFLTREDMAWFWDNYLRSDVDAANPYASPLRARDLSDLPPATVVTAGFDVLRDEGVAYARRLDDAGVDVDHRHYERMIHGFATKLTDPEFPQAREVVDAAGDALRDAFGR